MCVCVCRGDRVMQGVCVCVYREGVMQGVCLCLCVCVYGG